MAKKMSKPKPAKAKPGPKPETYKIEGGWEDAVKKSFQKKNWRRDGRRSRES
jgi:hypothetical protein